MFRQYPEHILTVSNTLPQYGNLISRIFPKYFLDISMKQTDISILWTGQNYGNWIFQPFSADFQNISILYDPSFAVKRKRLLTTKY